MEEGDNLKFKFLTYFFCIMIQSSILNLCTVEIKTTLARQENRLKTFEINYKIEQVSL